MASRADAYPALVLRMLLWISAAYQIPAMIGTLVMVPARTSSPVHQVLERFLVMTHAMDVPGAAALAIVESLLLALNDRNVLPEREILGILKDAALAHSDMSETTDDPGHHSAVAALINRILAGGNSVRRR